MRTKCAPKAAKFVVLNFIFSTGLFHDTIERWIMNVADLWKKVMLNLKIETTKQPGKYLTARSEIGRGLNLVDHPFFFDLGLVNGFEFGFFNDMGQLEYGGQAHATDSAINQQSNKCRQPSNKNDRNNDK